MNACCLCVHGVEPIFSCDCTDLCLYCLIWVLYSACPVFAVKDSPLSLDACSLTVYPSFTLQVSKSSDSPRDSTTTVTESSSLGVSSPATTGNMSPYVPTGPALPPLPPSPPAPPPLPPTPPPPTAQAEAAEEESAEKPDLEARDGSIDEGDGTKDEKSADTKEVEADSQVRCCLLRACLSFCHSVLYSPSDIWYCLCLT